MNDSHALPETVVLGYRVQAFLAHEASLLDTGRFDDWLDLFDDGAVYWIPSSADQADMQGRVSIVLENKALLGVRVARLGHPDAHAIDPRPNTVHLVGSVHLLDSPGAEGTPLVVRSALLMVEQHETHQTTLSGWATHHLRDVDGSFKIAHKRVDLAQCAGVLPIISIPL